MSVCICVWKDLTEVPDQNITLNWQTQYHDSANFIFFKIFLQVEQKSGVMN